MENRINNKFVSVGSFAFFGLMALLLWVAKGDLFWSAVGIAFALFLVYYFVLKIGHEIPIRESIALMACLQWVVGPYIDFHTAATHYKYHMYVDEAIYMAYAVPGVLALWLGLGWFKQCITLDDLKQHVTDLLQRHPVLPYWLLGVGLFLPLLNPVIPPALRFVTFLLSNLKYVGATYILLSPHKNRWIIYLLVMLFTVSASLASGMFHDLLLWGLLTFTFVAKELKFSLAQKISLFVVGIFLAMTIQAVKPTYREMIHAKGVKGGPSLFVSLAVKEWQSGTIVSPTGEDDINVRLNQGWIISAIMNHVPAKEPYASGSTIYDALYSSFLPRFLDPEKKKAGGRDNFMKYTGLELGQNTSMGISLAGEGWANYGYWGGILFLFFWGFFISWFWKKLVDWSHYYPTLLLWSPILFLQVVKAETELVVVLNHLIKASVLVFGLLWFIKRQWGIRV